MYLFCLSVGIYKSDVPSLSLSGDVYEKRPLSVTHCGCTRKMSLLCPFVCKSDVKTHKMAGGYSAVGMCKAALEVINGMNLYGSQGAHWSVIFIDIDAHYRNRTTFNTTLPRESASKVSLLRVVALLLGAALLSNGAAYSTISWWWC